MWNLLSSINNFSCSQVKFFPPFLQGHNVHDYIQILASYHVTLLHAGTDLNRLVYHELTIITVTLSVLLEIKSQLDYN